MLHIREYLISVTAAALLCGILQAVVGQKSSGAGLLKLISGIFLALTVIRPLADIRLEEFALLTQDIQSDSAAAVTQGADYARQATARQMKEQLEAYIQEKAGSMDVTVTADVTLEGDPPMIGKCTLQGSFSPYAKRQLSRMLQQDLGIPEEDQQWIHESPK